MRSSRLRSVLFWAGCFVVPIAMLCVVAAVRGVYPFGGQSFLTEDLKYQYVDFFAWFRRVLTGQESVFYSTACGLGANTWGLYSYYLASPFNLLVLLFDQDHLTLFAFVVDALKLGCIQLAATFYLRRRFGLVRGHATVLALGYTWGLWSATNLRNPMWMDALILLPLLMWAVWLLVRTRRWVPLALLTAADVICCWYTAYMTVLFLILWTILEWWCAGRSDEAGTPVPLWRLAARFARPMLVALALSAWTFVPTVLSMVEAGGVEETSFVGIIQGILGAGSLRDAVGCLFTTTPAYLLRGLVPALYDRAHAIPQLYCGVLLMCGYVAFFVSHGVPRRAKRGLAAFTAVMLASIVLSPLQAIWCGFRAPTGFYSRLCVFVAPAMMWATAWVTSSGRQAGAGKRREVRASRLAALGLLVAADLTLGACLAWRTVYTDYTQYGHDAYVSESREQVAELKARDGGTWRMERTFTRAAQAALNEAMSMDYVGLSSYSSAHDQGALDFLSALGYNRREQISMRYAHPILASDALLGVRYACSAQAVAGESAVAGISKVDGAVTYENPYALSLGYLVSDNAAAAALDGTNPFERQNEFASALVGHEVELFRPAEATQVPSGDGLLAWDVSVPAGCVGYAYVNTPLDYEDGVVMDVDGTSEVDGWQWQNALWPFTEVEGEGGGMHRVTVGVNASGGDPVPLAEASCDFYCLDLATLRDVVGELSGGQVSFDSFGGDGILGTVTADADGWCMISVPHEAGWTVRANGTEVQTQGAFGGALTLVPVTAGENRIEMKFVSPGFVPGCALSAVAVVGLCAWCLRHRRRHRA